MKIAPLRAHPARAAKMVWWPARRHPQTMQQIGSHACAMHILVCTNDRDPASGMPCCARAGGDAVYGEFKAQVSARGATGAIWVTKTACLGFCSDEGATIAVHPSALFTRGVKRGDVAPLLDRAIAAHIARRNPPG